MNAETLTGPQRAQWETLVESGSTAQERSDYEAAAREFEAAIELDETHAALLFRYATCLLRQGKEDEAKHWFGKARDYDTLCFRSGPEINLVIRAVAATANEGNTYLVDAAEAIAGKSSGGIPGEEFFLEHVHFNFAGNYELATLFAAKLEDAMGLTAPANAADSLADCADRLGHRPYHELLLLQHVEKQFAAPPFDQQLDHAERAARLASRMEQIRSQITPDAVGQERTRAEQSVRNLPDDWHLRKQLASILDARGDSAGAATQWREVTRVLPHYPIGYYQLGRACMRAQQWPEAEQALRMAISLRPYLPHAHNSLGVCRSRQHATDESYRHFAKAVELKPGYAEAYVNWGLVLAGQQDMKSAAERYRAAVKANPDFPPAHYNLGKIANRMGDRESATIHYAEVVRLVPNDPTARLNLGVLYLKQRNKTLALEHLEKAVTLDPQNATAGRYLKQARLLAE